MNSLFLKTQNISLKVCGVTTESDALELVQHGVEALGVNFWHKSKRYLSPDKAGFLKNLKGEIVRVGVFVNAEKQLPVRLYEEGYLDFVQFHGDEDLSYCSYFADKNIPYIRAIGVKDKSSIQELQLPGCVGILLDAHAPGVYGGTGETCDWSIIEQVNEQYPGIPILLAGGITVENVSQARELKHVVALDVASGAESEPGVKDFEKVKRLMS